MDWERNNKRKLVGRKFGYDVDHTYLDLTHVTAPFKDKRVTSEPQNRFPDCPPSQSDEKRAGIATKVLLSENVKIRSMLSAIHIRAAFAKTDPDRSISRLHPPDLTKSFCRMADEDQLFVLANWRKAINRALSSEGPFALPTELCFLKNSPILMERFQSEHAQHARNRTKDAAKKAERLAKRVKSVSRVAIDRSPVSEAIAARVARKKRVHQTFVALSRAQS